MIRKLVKHGNSYALVIPRPILELLKIKEHTRLEIYTDGRGLYIIPRRGRRSQKQLDDTLTRLSRKVGRALKPLDD
jgi:antitoxin MazE